MQGRTTLQSVRAALAGGAGVVQLRLKDVDGGPFLEQVNPPPTSTPFALCPLFLRPSAYWRPRSECCQHHAILATAKLDP